MAKMFSHIERDHLFKSARWLLIGLILLAVGLPNWRTFGDFLCIIGGIVLFYAFLHPWGNPKYYFIGLAAAFVLFSLVQVFMLIFHTKVTEDLMWLVGGICMVVFLAVIVGIVIFSDGYRRLLYLSATMALFAVFVMLPETMRPDANMTMPLLLNEYLVLIIQLAAVAALFRIASRKDDKGSNAGKLILIAASVLILMGIWGFMLLERADWAFGNNLWSVLEISAGLTAILAWVYLKDEQDEVS